MQEEHPILKVAQLLNEESFSYCLIGGYAVAIHGEPRATYDVDFLISCSFENLQRLHRKCKEKGWEAELRKAGPGDPVGDVVRIYSPFAADFLRARSPLELDCIQRANEIKLLGQKIRVVSAEDAILLLLHAGDPRSFYDALGILRVLESSTEASARKDLEERAQKYGLAAKVRHLFRGEFEWDFTPPQFF